MNKPLRLFYSSLFAFGLLEFFFLAPLYAIDAPLPRPVLNTMLSSSSVHMGDELTFVIEISWLGRVDQWNVTTPRLETQKLELENVAPSSSTEEGRTVKRFTFTFLPQQKGNARIESGNIFCYAKGSEKPETLRIPTQEIKIKSARNAFFSFSRTKVIFSLLLLILPVISFLMLLSLKKRKSNKPIQKILEREDLLLEELNIIPQKYPETLKQYDLSAHVLRKFLIFKLHLPEACGFDDITSHVKTMDWSLQEKKWTLQLLSDIREKQFAGSNISQEDVRKLKNNIEQFIQSKRVIQEVA